MRGCPPRRAPPQTAPKAISRIASFVLGTLLILSSHVRAQPALPEGIPPIANNTFTEVADSVYATYGNYTTASSGTAPVTTFALSASNCGLLVNSATRPMVKTDVSMWTTVNVSDTAKELHRNIGKCSTASGSTVQPTFNSASWSNQNICIGSLTPIAAKNTSTTVLYLIAYTLAVTMDHIGDQIGQSVPAGCSSLSAPNSIEVACNGKSGADGGATGTVSSSNVYTLATAIYHTGVGTGQLLLYRLLSTIDGFQEPATETDRSMSACCSSFAAHNPLKVSCNLAQTLNASAIATVWPVNVYNLARRQFATIADRTSVAAGLLLLNRHAVCHLSVYVECRRNCYAACCRDYCCRSGKPVYERSEILH
jgi:hypothetical protein